MPSFRRQARLTPATPGKEIGTPRPFRRRFAHLGIPVAVVPSVDPPTPGYSPVAGQTDVVSVAYSERVLTIVVTNYGNSALMDAALGGPYRLTVTSTCTINAVNIVQGRPIRLILLTSGTSSFTVTLGTGFLSSGTIATGTVTAKRWVLDFVESGGFLVETSREGPL